MDRPRVPKVQAIAEWICHAPVAAWDANQHEYVPTRKEPIPAIISHEDRQ